MHLCPVSYINKSEFWNDLNELGNLMDGPWCVGGDFNKILYSADRKGCKEEMARLFPQFGLRLRFDRSPINEH